jgi:hypothetical protein
VNDEVKQQIRIFKNCLFTVIGKIEYAQKKSLRIAAKGSYHQTFFEKSEGY